MAGENINRRLNIYINDKEVVNSMGGVTRAITQTKNALKALVRGSENYDSEVARLTNQLSDLTDHQESFRNELQLTTKDMGAARESALSFFSSLATGDVAGAQTALLGMRAAIVSSAAAMAAFVATPIGAFLLGLAAIAGVTKLWINYNEEVYKANVLTNSITKLTGDNLDAVRVKAQSLSETFDQDFTKVLETARVLVNEFHISYADALDQLEVGLIKGGAANNEFLDSMKEYPTFFANAGYSLEEFQSIINSGIDLGIYSDKLPDALKEFTLSVNEQTKSSSDALRNAFGKEFTDTLLKGIKSGAITAKEALTLVSSEAERIGLNAQQAQQLTADLFRGAGEDAGGALKIFEAVRKSIASQKEPLDEVQIAIKRLADSTEDAAAAQDRVFKSDGYAKWKINALSALNTVKSGFLDLIFEIFNSQDALDKLRGKESERKSVKQYADDSLKNFEDYATRRKKTMGDLYDFEAVKEERLSRIREQIAVYDGKKLNDQQTFQLKTLKAEYDAVKNHEEKVTVVKNKNAAADQDAAAKSADEAAKLREKELAAAKKHSEELLKQEQELQKQLLATRRSAEDLKLGLIKDDFIREKAIVDADYSRKIEDLKANILKEQSEISKIKIELSSSKTSNSDSTILKKQLAERLEIQLIHNQTISSTEQTRLIKIAALEEKYLEKSFKDQEAGNARTVQNLQTRQTNQLNSLKTLEDAKAVLSQFLSDDELAKIKTLNGAKKIIKQKFLEEEFKLQQQQLIDIMAKANEILGKKNEFGIELISLEQREIVLKHLDEVAAKLAALGVKDPNAVDQNQLDLSSLSGIDILGFTAEQWQGAFDNLDSFDGKMKALEITVAGVQNAFGMYFQFLEAGEKRNLQKAEATNRKKQADLSDQLEKGYITQEVYTARKAKLEAELAKKQAEIQYKQAKREKIMKASSIIANTAMGIMQIWGHSPDPTGISQGVLTAIISGIGAVNLGLVLAQPLPNKNGFKVGGFTGKGSSNSVAGDVHFGEYVVPQNVLFSNDPVVPQIMGYLEAKRNGKTPKTQEEPIATDQNKNSGSSSSQETNALANLVYRAVVVLEKLEEDGVVATLVNDIKSAKKIRDKIKEVNKLETNAKL